MGPNDPPCQVFGDDSQSYFLFLHFLSIFTEAVDEHRQGGVHMHQRPHLPWPMYNRKSVLPFIPTCLVVEMRDLFPLLDEVTFEVPLNVVKNQVNTRGVVR